MILTSVFLAIFHTIPILGVDEAFILRGGFHVVAGKEDLLGGQHGRNDNPFVGYGVNTHFSYKWTRWEMGLFSFVHFGQMEGLHYEAAHRKVSGEGHFRQVSFGPFVKYITSWVPHEDWFFYTTLGVAHSILSLKFDDFEVEEGHFSDEHKFTYLSEEANIGIGFEQQKRYREDHQVFVEFLIAYRRSYSVSLVDFSKSRRVNTLGSSPTHDRTHGPFFLLSLGLLIL